MWEPQLTLARSGWRVVAPHWRGLQGDEPPAESFDAMSESVVDLLGSVGVSRAVVCGVSMGGYLAFALLRRAPQLVRALVLCDTRAEADAPQARDGRLRMLATLEEQGVGPVADEMIPRLLGETTRQTRPEIASRVRELALTNRREGVAGVITAMMTRVDSTPLLPTIVCPAQILVGDEDVITPPAMSEAMHRAIPRSELVVFKQVGHLPNLERPDEFNATLARFLSGLTADS
jgi:pimeloyl-ACP methyl ester carboxylesterase